MAVRWGSRVRELVGLTIVVLLVVAVATAAHLVSVARLTLGAAGEEGRLLSRQLLHQAAHVLQGAGATPARLRADPSLRAVLDGIVGYSRVVVYGAIVDASGRVLVHSDPALEGRTLPGRPALDDVLAAGLPRLVGMLREPQIFEIALPVRLGDRPFGVVRVGVSTSLVRQELGAALVRSLAFGAGALLLAVAVGLGAGRVVLSWLQRIARRVARRDVQIELGPGDDMGRLAERMKGLGDRIHEAARGGAPTADGSERLQNAVVLVRPDGTVRFANAAAERLLGASMGGRPLARALPVGHPLAELGAALLGPDAEPRHRTVTLDGPDGPRDCAASGYPLRDDPALAGAILVLRDLEPVRAVESLVSYSQKLAALGRLTSGVTHEVKNPLNAMRIHLELLRARLAQAGGGPPLSREVTENLDVIAHEIQRLDRVVQGFLRFIRPQDLRLAPVDLNALVAGVARVAAPEGARAGVEIVLDSSPGLPHVAADAELITQACTNLVSNAIQAMPAGGTLTIATRRGAHGAVEVRVADQGVGIAPEDVDKIFRLYYTTKPEGSGIGLALVYRIVQMHDGRIDVESTVGKGTTVTVTLPTAPAAP